MLRLDADAPKPPAYPFITSQSQRAIRRQKTCDPPITWRIPSRLAFRFSKRQRRLVAVASDRHRRVFASVKGYVRRPAGTRKSKKHRSCKNFTRTRKHRKIWWLTQEIPQSACDGGNILSTAAPIAPLRQRPDSVVAPLAAAACRWRPTPRR